MDDLSSAVIEPHLLSDDELLGRLRSHYKQKRAGRFSFGCGGYQPFVQVNGDTQGRAYDLMVEVANKLETKPDPRPKQKDGWDGLFGELNRRHIETIADPIVASIERPFHIVPYVKISSCVLLFDRESEMPIEKCTDAVGHYYKAYKAAAGFQTVDRNVQAQAFREFCDQTRDKLTELISGRKGFAVTAGVLEEYFLRFIGVHVNRRMEGADLVTNAVNAVKEGFFVFTDRPTVQEALRRLSSQGKSDFHDKGLLGEEPFMVFAGFAFRPEDALLQEYFIRLCRDENGFARRWLNQLPATELKQMQIEVLPPSAIPARPIQLSSAAALWLFHANLAPTPLPDPLGVVEPARIGNVCQDTTSDGSLAAAHNQNAPHDHYGYVWEFLVLVAGFSIIAVIKGLPASLIWSSLAITGGTACGFLFLRESRITDKGEIPKVCFSIAGLLLIYEAIAVALGILSNHQR